MSDPEIIALKAEIEKLRKELAELQEGSFKHFEMFTAHLIEQDRDITDLFSYVMPILQKTYPDFAPTKKEFDAVLNRKSPQRFRVDRTGKNPGDNA